MKNLETYLREALEIIERDFAGDVGLVGPRRVAEFLSGESDQKIQADVTASFDELLRQYRSW